MVLNAHKIENCGFANILHPNRTHCNILVCGIQLQSYRKGWKVGLPVKRSCLEEGSSYLTRHVSLDKLILLGLGSTD